MFVGMFDVDYADAKEYNKKQDAKTQLAEE